MFLLLLARSRYGHRRSKEAESGISVGDLARLHATSSASVSHCLKELRQSCLIRMERQGKNVYCLVDPDAAETLASIFSAMGIGLISAPVRRDRVKHLFALYKKLTVPLIAPALKRRRKL
jgi:hypothetical protein